MDARSAGCGDDGPRRAAQPGENVPEAVLALDIGGTKLAAGVVCADGRTLSYGVWPTRVEEGPEVTLGRLFALGEKVLAEAGTVAGPDGGAAPGPGAVRLLGTGIGCGGPLDPYTGVLLQPPHLPGWVRVPVVRLARERFALPAVLDNDGTAAAAGQWRFGAGRGCDHLLYLTVSTGIGGGLVLGGRTFRGGAGNGGEPGHVTVRSGGRRCRSCGRDGCLEAYASGTSIAERAVEAVAEAVSRGTATVLAECDPLTAAEVDAAARRGDPVAAAVWEETVETLGSGLTSLVNVYEPEVVVLGGGVTRAGERLLGPVRRLVAEGAMGPAARTARIVPALDGARAGVLGAAAVGLERLPEAG